MATTAIWISGWWMVDGGQRRIHPRRHRQVVEADHAHIVGDAHTGPGARIAVVMSAEATTASFDASNERLRRRVPKSELCGEGISLLYSRRLIKAGDRTGHAGTSCHSWLALPLAVYCATAAPSLVFQL